MISELPQTAAAIKPFPPSQLGVSDTQKHFSVTQTHDMPFLATSSRPPACVAMAFGCDPLHVLWCRGLSWDLQRAIQENVAALYRSVQRQTYSTAAEPKIAWNYATLQFGPRLFLCTSYDDVFVYAQTVAEAQQLITWFNRTYSAPPKTSSTDAGYYLIKIDRIICCQRVPLTPPTIFHDDLLELHYGVDSPLWNRGLVSDMSQKRAGLVIFDGAPGTGKTYYLRHLMETLKESHRFYFLPPSYIDLLTRPDFIGFWAEQRQAYSDSNFVVIIEDAEGALMSRGGDNRNQVSSLLNLSSGMLADFLRLQIICTVNCAATSIDPALLRPGRLICHKHFPRLDYASAARLADSLGKNLPQSRDYSLAEIFAESVPNQPVKHSLGFN